MTGNMPTTFSHQKTRRHPFHKVLACTTLKQASPKAIDKSKPLTDLIYEFLFNNPDKAFTCQDLTTLFESVLTTKGVAKERHRKSITIALRRLNRHSKTAPNAKPYYTYRYDHSRGYIIKDSKTPRPPCKKKNPKKKKQLKRLQPDKSPRSSVSSKTPKTNKPKTAPPAIQVPVTPLYMLAEIASRRCPIVKIGRCRGNL